jgi:hypothetical protein
VTEEEDLTRLWALEMERPLVLEGWVEAKTKERFIIAFVEILQGTKHTSSIESSQHCFDITKHLFYRKLRLRQFK